MFKKEERMGLIIHLYYNRDAKKLAHVGDIIYHSKKHRYLQLYVAKDQADSLKESLSKESYIKKSRPARSKIWIRILLEACLETKKTLLFKKMGSLG